MSKYKKVPSLVSKERRDVYKYTGNSDVNWGFLGVSREGMEEFTKAIKRELKAKGLDYSKMNFNNN